MAINSVQIKKGSSTKTVEVGSSSYKKYLADGYKVVPGTEKNAPKSSSSSSNSTPSSSSTKTSSSSSSSNNNSSSSSNSVGTYNDNDLKGTNEFKALSAEDQEAVLAVFNAVASNDKTQATRMIEAFKASSKINDPYFAQQLKLAVDAIERGYVSIDKEAEFAELQLKNRLADIKSEFESRKQYLTLEQAGTLKQIEQSYQQNLEGLQENMASTGFTQSSRRKQKEEFLQEATGDLRESTQRKFSFDIASGQEAINISERDTQSEIERLKKLTEEKKLDFLRSAEKQVGSKGLPNLSGAPAPLGGIYGDIPEEKLKSTLSATQSFVF
jgi:predicted HTH domain antitoxin